MEKKTRRDIRAEKRRIDAQLAELQTEADDYINL